MSTLVRYYKIYFGGVEIGKVKNGDLSVKFNDNIVELKDIAGYIGTAEAKTYGLVPEVMFTTFHANVANLWGIYLNGYTTVITSGADKSYHGGVKLIDLFADADTLVIHPGDLDDTDRSEDFNFHLARLTPENVELIGDHSKFQEIKLNARIFPDENRSVESRYFIIGDPTITNTPLKVWTQWNKKVNIPSFHVAALSLAVGQNEQVQGMALFGDIVTTATGAIDDATDISASDTSIVFDTMAGGTFIADEYYVIESEYIYVTAVTMSSTTAGTLTAVRGVCGTTAAAHVDDTVITMVTGSSIENQTAQGTWASSDVAKVTIGDTYLGSGTTLKGVANHVATGPSNITMTLNSVASPNLVITAA